MFLNKKKYHKLRLKNTTNIIIKQEYKNIAKETLRISLKGKGY